MGCPNTKGTRGTSRGHWFHGVGFRVDLSGPSVESRADSRIAHKERFTPLEHLEPTKVSSSVHSDTEASLANYRRTQGTHRCRLIPSPGWPLAGRCPSTRPIRLCTSGRNVTPASYRTWIDPFLEKGLKPDQYSRKLRHSNEPPSTYGRPTPCAHKLQRRELPCSLRRKATLSRRSPSSY
jgi:hypothetical protein